MGFDFKKILNFFKEEDKEQESVVIEKEKGHEVKRSHQSNIILIIITVIIVVTFTFSYGTGEGIQEFRNNLFNEKIKNPDGSISIPAEAQSRENMSKRKPTDLYIGKVLGTMIQLNKDDDFNRNVSSVLKYEQFNPYQKYQYVRYYYDQEMNKIIGMHNAKKMDIITSNDYLIKEVGKRYFTDNNGEINYDLMRREVEKVNQVKGELVNQILFENFTKDYFYGLPVSQDEVLFQYKIDNLKMVIEYVDISNNNVPDDKLKDFYEKNKEEYKKYKLVRLVFNKKDDALANLSKFNNEPEKFIENAEKLKSENKLNISYDSDAVFLDSFEEPELKEGLKDLTEGKVLNKVAKAKIGYLIVKVDKKIDSDFSDIATIEKVKKDYIDKNLEVINNINKAKAEEIYNYAKTSGLSGAKQKFKVAYNVTEPMGIVDVKLPNLDPEKADDLNYVAKVFKASKNETVEPYNYGKGFLVVRVLNKTDFKEDDYKPLYNDLLKRYSDEKSGFIATDYYRESRKKLGVIDNFNYVFTYEMFMPSKGE